MYWQQFTKARLHRWSGLVQNPRTAVHANSFKDTSSLCNEWIIYSLRFCLLSSMMSECDPIRCSKQIEAPQISTNPIAKKLRNSSKCIKVLHFWVFYSRAIHVFMILRIKFIALGRDASKGKTPKRQQMFLTDLPFHNPEVAARFFVHEQRSSRLNIFVSFLLSRLILAAGC